MRHRCFQAQSSDLKDNPSLTGTAARQEAWRSELVGLVESGDENALYKWLHGLGCIRRLALFAFCIVYDVNVLQTISPGA